MKTLKTIWNEYQKLSLLLIDTIGKKTDFPPRKNDGKKSEINQSLVALNILHVP